MWSLKQLGYRLLSYQDPILKHHRSPPTANRCPHWGRVLPLYRGTVSVFNSPSRQSGLIICLHTMKWLQVLLFNTNNSIWHQSFISTWLKDQTVLFLTIQFCISHLFAHSLNVKQFFLTHKTLSGATTPGPSGPRSNGNKGVICIPQSSSITEASASDCLVSF